MSDFGDAIILCGGKSRRMGFDKALARIDGRYVIEIMYDKLSRVFDSIKLSSVTRDRFGIFDIEVVEDLALDAVGNDIQKGGLGPSVAIYSSLVQASSKYVFFIAVDMPLLDIEYIKHMQSIVLETSPNILVPINSREDRDNKEPLYGFYSRDTINIFKENLQSRNYKMHDILEKCGATYLGVDESRKFDEDLRMFTNLNYPSDVVKLGGISYDR